MADESTCRALEGALLGTAVADALGLPYEGMDPRDAALEARDFGRFHLFGRWGFVSDDTQQSALVVESVLAARGDWPRALRHFRRALCVWFLCLPFGIGLATLRACLRIATGQKRTGVHSAGNGAAMRSAALGVLYADDDARRRAAARAFAGVTHTDARAVEGAMFVAELAARCANEPGRDRGELVLSALPVVRNTELREAIEGAVLAAGSAHDSPPLENRGYVVHTLEIACHAFVRDGDGYERGVRAAILRGGDTDTNAAIVGAWLGILHGASTIPRTLVGELARGPFDVDHLRALARGERVRWSARALTLRNLSLFPVVVGHGLARLFRRLVSLGAPTRRVVQNGR